MTNAWSLVGTGTCFFFSWGAFGEAPVNPQVGTILAFVF